MIVLFTHVVLGFVLTHVELYCFYEKSQYGQHKYSGNHVYIDLSDGIFYNSGVPLPDFSSYGVAVLDLVIRNTTAISIHSFDELFTISSDQAEILYTHTWVHACTHTLSLF